MLGELTEEQINNVLASHALGRLACSDGKKPYIVPVTYTYDGKFIYGQTNEGTKLKIMRQNPNVCFEVDNVIDMRNWQSVIIYGKFEELKDAESNAAREILFGRVFSLNTSSTVHAYEHEVESKVDDSTRVKFVMYKIHIEKKTGRFEKQ